MMKKLVATTCLLLSVYGAMAQKTSMSVDVRQPGTLAECVGDANKYSVKSLTIKGRLNTEDVIFLREMAGRDSLGHKVDLAKLESLNLQEASFVASPRPFLKKKDIIGWIATDGGDLPDYIFNGCQLKEIVFPKTTRKIGKQALYGNQLTSITLPEYAELGNWAFGNNQELQEVIFPQTLLSWLPCVFGDCSQLKELKANNVVYISGQSIARMASLEQVCFQGWILHTDGYCIIQCPELQTVVYNGEVFSTGGAQFAESCPKLERLIFHAPVFATSFGVVKDCPSFKGITAEDLVVSSSFKEMLPPSLEAEIASHYTMLNDKLNRCIKQLQEDSLYDDKVIWWEKVARQSLMGTTYNHVCQLALANDRQNAMELLERLVADGFREYYHFLQDTDLNSLRDETRFQQMMEDLKKTEDKIVKLKASPEYVHGNQTNMSFTFSYQEPSDSMLTAIRQYFRLDSIAGNGDEISRIKNIMYWLHDAIRHDGSSSWPECRYNAIELYELTKREKRGLNCRFLSEVLNDLYLAAGFKSRFLTCQSKEYDTDSDCHVINIVWSDMLGKWLWMDASFAAYVTDENGLLLHPGEVRERMRHDLPLILNEDANWNHEEQQSKTYYLDYYMAKNLYLMSSHLRSETESEGFNKSNKSIELTLVPHGFKYKNGFTTEDDQVFWQKPE